MLRREKIRRKRKGNNEKRGVMEEVSKNMEIREMEIKEGLMRKGNTRRESH